MAMTAKKCGAARAGQLDKKIIIQTFSESNTGGEVALTPSTHATVWASIQPLRGQERMNAAQVTPEVTHKITIRYLSTLTSRMRISWDSRFFGIVSIINPLERNERQELMCKELT